MKDRTKKQALWAQDAKTAVHIPTSESQARLKAMRERQRGWEEDANTTVRHVNAPLPVDAYPEGAVLEPADAPANDGGESEAPQASRPGPEIEIHGAPVSVSLSELLSEPASAGQTSPESVASPAAASPRVRRRPRRGRAFALRTLAFVATAVVFWTLGHALAQRLGHRLGYSSTEVASPPKP